MVADRVGTGLDFAALSDRSDCNCPGLCRWCRSVLQSTGRLHRRSRTVPSMHPYSFPQEAREVVEEVRVQTDGVFLSRQI